MAKILVVDDDAKIREVISRCLETDGHDVITAENGEKAIKMATKGWKQPSLVILDVNMPGMNGLEVLQKLKDHRKTCMIPVLMLTALHDDEIMHAAMGNYALQFLTKPISMAALSEKVTAALGE